MEQFISSLPSGASLSHGKYVIEQKIGSGGFGITYRAVQTALDRTVCIKEYYLSGRCVRNSQTNAVVPDQADVMLFEKYRQTFVNEAKTLAKLHHAGVVEILDVFNENNTAYMVMSFIEGRSLQSIVDEQGSMPYADAVNYIAQVTDAVAYIHEHHILHRDIKPGNIMITPDFRAILIDFGSAREFENDKTQAHTSIITHGYAPTEQYSTTSRKGSYTDIYAIGATLYFLLTGKVPLDAPARMSERMPEPKQLNPSIPDEANRTIMKAMQLNTADRHQSAAEFMADLRNPNSSTVQSSTVPTAVDTPTEENTQSYTLTSSTRVSVPPKNEESGNIGIPIFFGSVIFVCFVFFVFGFIDCNGSNKIPEDTTTKVDVTDKAEPINCSNDMNASKPVANPVPTNSDW
ncbi:MAG: serine/threonine protein kinase [Bacteroidales bacterium]|nr:serine/threonine protein kinase [Bacteroidales bacterium]